MEFTDLQIFIFCACVYIIVACLFLRAIANARPLQTSDGCTEDVPGSPAAPLPAPPTGRCRPVDVDGPPVTLKLPPIYGDGDYLMTHKRVLLITGCTDSSMWYSKMIGQEVPYFGQWADEQCYKSREPAGYVNIVKFADAKLIIKEPA